MLPVLSRARRQTTDMKGYNMELERLKRYADIFGDLLDSAKMSVKWSRTGYVLRTSKQLESHLKEIDKNFSKKEFEQYARYIIRALKFLCNNENPKDDDDKELFPVVDELVLSPRPDLRNNILVRTTTFNTLFEGISNEIVTKRSRSNPKKVLGFSALLNIHYVTVDDEELSLTMEVSKTEIETLISHLMDVKETLDELQFE